MDKIVPLVLLIEPNPVESRAIQAALARLVKRGYEMRVVAVGSIAEHTDKLAIDLLILPYSEKAEVSAFSPKVTLGMLNTRKHQSVGHDSNWDGVIEKGSINESVLLPWVVLTFERMQRAIQQIEPTSVALMASAAHDLRLPLMAMDGIVRKFADPTLDVDEYNQLIKVLGINSEFLSALIDNVLTLTQIRSGNLHVSPVNCSVVDLIQELRPLLEEHASQRELFLNVDFIFPLPRTVNTDPTRLKQILLNLVGNAIKYTEEGGVSLVISYSSQKGALVFDVIDTGIGISVETQTAVFEPFNRGILEAQRRFSGFGLGLTIAKALGECLGGRIECVSAPGSGSRFSFSLEVGEAAGKDLVESMPELKQQANQPASRLKGKVLIADDMLPIRQMLELQLKKVGAKVVTARNGKEAVKRAGREKFDLILMDVEMPVLDGLSAIQRIRESGNKTPIIALTGYGSYAEMKTCISSGADGFMRKTCDHNELIKSVAKYMQVEEEEAGEEGPASSLKRREKIRQRFLDRVRETLPKLRETATSRDWKALRSLNHPLIAGKMFGFSLLSEVACDFSAVLEDARRTEESVDEMMHYLEKVMEKILDGEEEGEKELIRPR